MRYLTIIILSAIIIVACNKSGNNYNTNLPAPKTFDDSVSFMIGNNIGKGIHRDSININMDYFVLGILKAMKGDSGFIPEKDLQNLSQRFQSVMMKKNESKMKIQGEQVSVEGKKNKDMGDKYLAENKAKPGVITTESGLQYQILKEGTGKKITEDDMISFHIKGFRLDGTKFDDSKDRGKPVQLGVKTQVPGWKETFLKMKVGSIYKIVMPPSIGWGERGAPPQIQPNSVTIFEFEILSIDGKIPAQNAQQPPPIQMQKPN